jgi:hypothetical protein
MSTPKKFAVTATLTIGAAASSLFCANGIAHAVCGSDRPCFTDVHMEGPTTLVATWTFPDEGYADEGYNFEQFRYSSAGGPEPQSKSYGPPYRIYGVQPGVAYTLKVQGCRITLFGSDCSPWDTTQFTVPAPEAPAPPPEPPRKVDPPGSNGAVNPYECLACQAVGN